MMASQVYDTRFAQFSRDLKVKATNGECTLMLRGIACRLTQEELKGILDDVGLCGKFSFVYVPRILARRSNLGYAFVRFRSTGFAEECFWSCHGRPLGPAAPDKLCEVTVAKVQEGADAILDKRRRKQNGQVPEVLLVHDKVLAPPAGASQPGAGLHLAGAAPARDRTSGVPPGQSGAARMQHIPTPCGAGGPPLPATCAIDGSLGQGSSTRASSCYVSSPRSWASGDTASASPHSGAVCAPFVASLCVAIMRDIFEDGEVDPLLACSPSLRVVESGLRF
mmetsp:Transcript_20678/g.58661  ORF Transcript_20678/g.58661 Transcript_20678/m.58661 type:complete len:280 (-) Transcript_20678:299-1138(-)